MPAPAAPPVWHLRTLADVPAGDDWLSADELAELGRGQRVPKRRADWRLGRFTAKEVVAADLGVDVARVTVAAAADGAPEAHVDGHPAPVTLSISHRGQWGLAVVGAAGVPVGGDLEIVEPRSDAFVREWFAPVEQRRILGAADRDRLGALVWSAKESAAKVLREGLRIDVRNAVVTLSPADGQDGWQPFRVDCTTEGQCIDGWWQVVDTLVITVASAVPTCPPVRLPG